MLKSAYSPITAVVFRTLTGIDVPTCPSVVVEVFAANGTYINISRLCVGYTSSTRLDILVAGLHRQVEALRAAHERGLTLQVLSELFVIKLHSRLRKIRLIINCWTVA